MSIPIKFTFDTNCLIDLDDERPNAKYIMQILRARRLGRCDVAIAASSASERQKSGDYLQSFEEFRERMNDLGLGDLEILPVQGRFDLGFWGQWLWSSLGDRSEEAIYTALFPNSCYEWQDYAAQKGEDPTVSGSKSHRKWRNQILDAQAVWAHRHSGRDVFVTSDANFEKLNKIDFDAFCIRTPNEAASMVIDGPKDSSR